MAETPLWMISISAFSAVMLLLGLLAVVIALLSRIFPLSLPVSPAVAVEDTALHLAAVQAAVVRQWPGAHVRHVEEHPQGDPR